MSKISSDKTMGGLFPFGFQQMPGGRPGGMEDIFYSMGIPGVWTKANGGFQQPSIYQDMFNKNLAQGIDPFTGFPDNMRGGSPQQSPNDGNKKEKQEALTWAFPQYASTWAFTPPSTFPVRKPPPFRGND